jgi:serine/threonine protein kinase
VAIKVLRSDLRRGAEAAARMLREAHALARLSHPNVVQVYEVGKVDGQGFIAMEYIDGAVIALTRGLAAPAVIAIAHP